MTTLKSFSSCIFWELVLIGLGILLLVGGMARFGWSDFIHSFFLLAAFIKATAIWGSVDIKEST